LNALKNELPAAINPAQALARAQVFPQRSC
jgi:hypothetical protein